jgi:hypothetical protein
MAGGHNDEPLSRRLALLVWVVSAVAGWIVTVAVVWVLRTLM